VTPASRLSRLLAAPLLLLLASTASPAAPAGDAVGASLSLVWVIPFAGMLLSIALMPLLPPVFWHHHYGKVAVFWSLAMLRPYGLTLGSAAAAHAVLHTVIAEYIPFVLLLLALYTVAGGIYLRGNLRGSPLVNTAALGIGTGMASFLGTTGASMLLIRPLIRANDSRRHRTHVIVFFIFLVSNIGGSLTPLGDPPLFLGFLQGVDFFWTTRTMLVPMLLTSGILLALFFAIDSWYYSRPGERLAADPTPDAPLRLEGWLNALLLGPLVLLAVLMSGVWKPGINFDVFGIEVQLQNLLRDAAMVVLALASLYLTPRGPRQANHFEWGPMVEVAKLFAGIFITIIPVIAILRAGRDGAMAPLVALVTRPDGQPNEMMYFWLTGVLSSFLDNAPTYLVFFNLAGGDAQQLMGPLSATLVAISAGAVFMGANTYIGNAPNFMVKAIATSRGVPMPSFFGYMLWSGLILLPIFALLSWVFFR